MSGAWRVVAIAAGGLAVLQGGLLAALWLAPWPPRALPPPAEEPGAPATPAEPPSDEVPPDLGYSPRDLCRLDTLLAERLTAEAARRGEPVERWLPEARLREGICPPGAEVPPQADTLLAAWAHAFWEVGLGDLPALGRYQ
ncbi:MAG: hypothetical protein ABIO70_30005 [Pseudomonadota bacterium]